jgi:hypothetical protein
MTSSATSARTRLHSSGKPVRQGVGMPRSDTGLLDAFRADVRSLSALRALALLAVPVLIAFEWGFGNDFANVFAISTAYESSSGIPAIARAMLAGFVVPFALQLIGGLVATLGFGALARSATSLRARIAVRSESIAGIAYSRLRLRDQWWVSVALGTTAAVLLEQGRPAPQHSASSSSVLQTVVLLSAAFMAVTTSLVAGLCASLLEISRQFETLAPVVDDLVGILTNPFAWVSVFVVVGAIRLLINRNGAPS